MIYGMYLSTAGGLVESAKADVIAHNLANASTPGFKRELMVFTRRATERDVRGEQFNTNPILDAIGGGVLIHDTYTDLSARPTEQTDNPFDLAIRGDGFFAVTDGRSTYYSRAGNFALDNDGFLTTADRKFRVLDESGSPIYAAGEEFAVAPDGTISARRDGVTEPIARLGIFDFAERADGPRALSNAIERHEGNLLRYRGEEATSIEGQVMQGVVEVSGVNPVEELTAMISANRAYEANLNMISAQDSTLQRLINQVGRIPG